MQNQIDPGDSVNIVSFSKPSRSRRTAKPPMRLAALALTLVLGGFGQARAMSSCDGTFAATSLHPLPSPMVVGLDIHDASPANQKLADRFIAGLRNAGITVGDHPNVLLHISTSQLGGSSSQTDQGFEPSYSDMSGLSGGIPAGMPPMPNARITSPRPAPSPPLLILRIDATEGQVSRISWVASAQCRRTGSDDEQLAQDLGLVFGAVIGKRVERRPF